MKKLGTKNIVIIALAIILVCSLSLNVFGDDLLETISCYLNRGVTIEYNGTAQEFKDVNGTRVFPLTYNGTTYLPVRAISNLYGIPVGWDGERNTVLLGLGDTNQRDLTKKYTGGGENNYLSNNPSEISNHTSCIVMNSNSIFSESWTYDDNDAFLRGHKLTDYTYDNIMKFDVYGIKQVNFTLNCNTTNGQIIVFGANSKADVGKDTVLIDTLATYTITKGTTNIDIQQSLNIDTTKYDTIMFKFDPTTSGEKLQEGLFLAYIYDLTGIPA